MCHPRCKCNEEDLNLTSVKSEQGCWQLRNTENIYFIYIKTIGNWASQSAWGRSVNDLWTLRDWTHHVFESFYEDWDPNYELLKVFKRTIVKVMRVCKGVMFLLSREDREGLEIEHTNLIWIWKHERRYLYKFDLVFENMKDDIQTNGYNSCTTTATT